MASGGIKLVSSKALNNLQAMVERGRDARGFFAQVAYPKYRIAQRQRFMTANASQTGEWKSVDPNSIYGKWKRYNYAGWVGDGQATNILTGRLASGLLGQALGGGESFDGASDHRLAIFESSMVITVTNPYIKYVDDVRPVMQFTKEFLAGLKSDYQKYLLGAS